MHGWITDPDTGDKRRPTLAERFWQTVDKDGAFHPDIGRCWEWTAGKTHNGYGRCSHAKGRGLHAPAHHVGFFLHHGRWPAGDVLRHKCDNPACVRPDHLLEGTQKQNIQDAVRAGRMALGERNGSAKLMRDQVVEIKALYTTGAWTQAALGKKFGVSQRTIGYVVSGKIWERVT